MSNSQWYESMAKAMKAREHALIALERWQGKLTEAESEIQQLALRELAAETQEHEQATEQE